MDILEGSNKDDGILLNQAWNFGDFLFNSKCKQEQNCVIKLQKHLENDN